MSALAREKIFKAFATELAIMIKLRSPRVVNVYGAVTTDPSYMGMVIEFCSGGDLRTRLDTDWNVVDRQRGRWLLDIALGMMYLYEHKVEHRDLKSANVLLDQNDRAKVW